MCGIVGFTGRADAVPILLDALSFLEYRGYDSAGIAFFDSGTIRNVKARGRLHRLKEKLGQKPPFSNCGIGHTRWATHGEPSEVNAHPHGTDRVSLVHNGIIENSDSIKSFLSSKGYSFSSDTDTEACAKLMDYYLGEGMEPQAAIDCVVKCLKGSYAICALFSNREGVVYSFCKDSPMVVAMTDKGGFVSSDVGVFPPEADCYYIPKPGEIAEVSAEGIVFLKDGAVVRGKKAYKLTLDTDAVSGEGYPHYMLKEIYYGPDAVRNTAASLMFNGDIDPDAGIDSEVLAAASCVHLIGCGTALNAALTVAPLWESMAKVPVRHYIASEFVFSDVAMSRGDLAIFVSQSGETADTLSALRRTKSMGIFTLALVNTRGSRMAHEADGVIYTHAGREMAVASTKAYCVQVGALYLLCFRHSVARGTISHNEATYKSHVLFEDVPLYMKRALELEDQCKALGKLVSCHRDVYYIGRGVDYALCLEGALKTKEVSYIHCEAYAAGEMKHGSIALIDKGTLVVAVLTKSSTKDKTINNIKELKSRGAMIVLLCSEDADIPEGTADRVVRLPSAEEIFMPLVCAAPLQLVAYHTADALGLDPDKPRNLAKSVTVE